MKKLLILRHSKAGQTNKKILDDHERPLTKKGVELCKNIAIYLEKNNHIPDMIICSSSTRTIETSKLIIENANLASQLIIKQKLYLASMNTILNLVQTLDESIKTAIVVAHNPGVQNFCIEFSGTGDKTLFRKMRVSFPPASLAIFHIHEDYWFNLSAKSGNLIDFTTNKPCKAGEASLET